MIELQQLSHLVAIYEQGTMTAAARTLHISQPALSRSVQRLEGELGLPLFEHGRNKTHINPVGVEAVERARDILRQVDELPRHLHACAHSLQTISVGSCGPAPMWLLADELRECFPDMTISTELAEQEQLIRGLLDNAYQLIVLDTPPDAEGIRCREHSTETLYLNVPRDHPLAARDGIRLEELAGATLLGYHDVGRWSRVMEKLTDVHFILQRERHVMKELIVNSSLPCLLSNMLLVLFEPLTGRVSVPILDDDATVVFYLCAAESGTAILDRVSPPASPTHAQ